MRYKWNNKHFFNRTTAIVFYLNTIGYDSAYVIGNLKIQTTVSAEELWHYNNVEGLLSLIIYILCHWSAKCIYSWHVYILWNFKEKHYN